MQRRQWGEAMDMPLRIIKMHSASSTPTTVTHGGRDDSLLSAILAKWPPKSRHQRNSCQILQNRATESRRACSKTIITNSPIRGFFDTDSFMSYVYEHHCFIGIFVGPLNTNCIKYQANQKWAKLELSLSHGKSTTLCILCHEKMRMAAVHMYHSTLMCSSQDYLVKTPIINRGGG